MLSFERFEAGGDLPIYQQIVLFVKRSIVSGSAPDGEELPSRRAISTLLTVNPNTVQKACRELEEEGLITSHSGARSFITAPSERVEKLRRELLESDVRSLLRAMRETGLSKEEALSLIDTVWEESE